MIYFGSFNHSLAFVSCIRSPLRACQINQKQFTHHCLLNCGLSFISDFKSNLKYSMWSGRNFITSCAFHSPIFISYFQNCFQLVNIINKNFSNACNWNSFFGVLSNVQISIWILQKNTFRDKKILHVFVIDLNIWSLYVYVLILLSLTCNI